uniref:Chitin-binding type-2 domain-containing protein n=1 Tax=Timema tahoe TaxID=61484 RepID=A0A7R9IEP3_9NEOP|nr:unnamed protein product [Timema tahoe]
MSMNSHQQILLVLWALAGVHVALAQNCTSAGRIAVTGTCNQYYLCVANGTSFIQVEYTCPGSSVFNTATSLCTTSITCSTSTSTSTSTIATTTVATCNDAGFICANSTSFILCVDGVASGDAQTCTTGTSCSSDCSLECSATTPCSSTTTVSTTTVSTTTLSSITTTEAFSCSSAGRFGVSSNCSLYYFCAANTTSGTYTQVLYICPGSSLFNTATSLCTTGTATCA